MHLVLLGPPGVGKGTQGLRLAQHFRSPHISTGNMLRDAVAKGTPLGQKVRSIMDLGGLVPDDVMIGVVGDRLAESDVRAGFVLDGFPRTVPQAEALDGILSKNGLGVDRAVVIDAPIEVIVSRLSGRRVCTVCARTYHVQNDPPRSPGQCDDGHGELIQREDDREDVTRDRISLYARLTAPLVDFYRKKGLMLKVAGEGPQDEVFDHIVRSLAGAGVV